MKQLTALTDRYVRHLLCVGFNHEFEIQLIERELSVIDDLIVGRYYKVLISDRRLERKLSTYPAVGTTPKQALRRALEKAGVTFR
jgi:hypothetical protein